MNIQPRDFRIGNIVQCQGEDGYFKIYSTHTAWGFRAKGDKGRLVEFEKDALQPVPLTEYLILRLGTVDEKGEWRQEFEKCFDADNNDILLSEYTLDSDGVVSMQVCLRILNDGFYLVDVQNDSGDVASLPIDLKHLHQLQNLYWCLCGKELVLNPVN